MMLFAFLISIILLYAMAEKGIRLFIKKLISKSDFNQGVETVLFIPQSTIIRELKSTTNFIIFKGLCSGILSLEGVNMIYAIAKFKYKSMETIVYFTLLAVIFNIVYSAINEFFIKTILKSSGADEVWSGASADGSIDIIYVLQTSHDLIDTIDELHEFIKEEGDIEISASSPMKPNKKKIGKLKIIKKDDKQ